jgi:hypothetical protein
MKIGHVVGALWILASSAALASACGGTQSSNFGDGDDAGDDATSGDGGASDATDDGFHLGDAHGDGGSCTSRCSSDLHSVLDCNGVVQMTCPSGQGCSGTGCVAACDAAKANKSTIGCDYYSVQPEGSQYQGGCYAVFVANTWNEPVTLTVGIGASTYSNLSAFVRIPSGSGQALTYAPLPNNQLPPQQVAILFLSSGGSVACPASANLTTPHSGTNVSGTAIGSAFHITASAPVVAYDIYPYGGGNSAITSATLLLPTSAWDTNYVAFNGYPMSQVAMAPPAIQLVAQEDGTNVTINPTVAIVGGASVAATAANSPHTYALNKGQVLEFAQPAELSGSPIQADKPIGMWSSAACFNIGPGTSYCDSTHQQIPPVKALGSEYVAVRYRSRIDATDEIVPWRIMGLLDGTTLTYEPAAPTGAPTTLHAGQVVELKSPGPFIVRSQDDMHPFYMGSYMTSCTFNGQDIGRGTFGCAGDPEFVNVVPGKQFLNSYVFFTDPTYPETNLVFVRTKSAGGFKDVTLDCAGTLTGWKPIGTAGNYEYTRFDLVRHNFAKQGSCDNGRHEAHSDAPFGLTVWGWGNNETAGFYTEAVSYGYPAGESVKPINTVVILPTPR